MKFKYWIRLVLILGFSAFLAAGCGKGGGGAAKAVAKSPADLSQAASLTGHVMLDGKPPKSEMIMMDSDDYCAKKHRGQTDPGDMLVKGGKVQNVVVYVKAGLEKWSFPTAVGAVSVDQKDCMYSPHVMIMRLGQTLKIINNDKTTHNIHAMLGEDTLFNVAQTDLGTLDQAVDRTGIITLKCDVHSWMNGYVAVFDNPCEGLTKADGSYSLGSLPPGTYTLAAWQEKLGTIEQQVTVGPKEKKTVDFTFHVK